MDAGTPEEHGQRTPLDVEVTRRRHLGPVGATAVVAAIVSIVTTVALGFIIPGIVERHLLDASAESIHRTVHDIAQTLQPDASLGEADLVALEEQVERSLLGLDIVRVKIWGDDSATILFSDEERLIGQTFEPSDDLLAAYRGEAVYDEPDPTRPENQYEQDLGELREFYIPIDSEPGDIRFVFEVYERADKLTTTVDRIRIAVWIALGAGSAILLTALAIAAVTNARSERERRERSQRLITQLLEAQEDERTRIVGALHDDIGQPLYRILFGLQASRDMVEEGSAVDQELEKLDFLVRDVDATLRSELTSLREEPGVEIDLELALAELVEMTEIETGLNIDFTSDVETDLPVPYRATLYRAAREALTNVNRHANATNVTLRLVEGRHSTMIEVTDDGTGTDDPPGLGLTTTRDRLEAIGGGITVSTTRGRGTRFTAWVPLENRERS